MKLRAHFDSMNKNKNSQKEKDNNNEAKKSATQEDRSEMSLLKNPYYNPTSSPPETLAIYIAAVKNSITKLWKRKEPVTDNLSEGERLALEALQEREDIVIQQADKGGKIVIMDREDYVKDLEAMLADKEFYKEEERDKTAEYADEIKRYLPSNSVEGMKGATKPFLTATEVGLPSGGILAELSHDDVVMETIWSRDFDKTNPRKAKEAWARFRVDVLAQHSVLREKLKQLQSECEVVQTIKDIMDLDQVIQQKEANNSISIKLAKADEEVQKVSLLMEKFAQYLSTEPHRRAMEASIQDVLEQFLHIVRQTNKRTEILNLVAPHLQRYLTSAGEVKTWLAHAEARCKYLTTLSITSMNCEAIVEKLVEEMIEKKITHDAMLLAYRGVAVVDGMEEFFNIHSNNLAEDKSGVIKKWENIKETLTKYVNEISTEKRTHIDNQLKTECQHCCCSMPYEIKKVGENRYTFGTSKTVRMVRQHGQSIVVRVGGGWEYLINFLSKVDPCRAKELAQDYMDNGEITTDNGVLLKSMDAPDASFQRPVVRLTKSIIPAKKKATPVEATGKATKVATTPAETPNKRTGVKKKPASKSSLKPTPSPRSASTSDAQVDSQRPPVPVKERNSKSQSLPPKKEKREVLERSSASTSESEETHSRMMSSFSGELPDESFIMNNDAEVMIEGHSCSSMITKEDEENSVVIMPAVDDEPLGKDAPPPTIKVMKHSPTPTKLKGEVPANDNPPTSKASTKGYVPNSKYPTRKPSPTPIVSNFSRSKSPIAPTKSSLTTAKASVRDDPLMNPDKSSEPTLRIPVSRPRARSADLTIGRTPSPTPRPTRTSTSREGRSKTTKTSTAAAEIDPKTSSSPRAVIASKRQRSKSASVLDSRGTLPKTAINSAKTNPKVGPKATKSPVSPPIKPTGRKTPAVNKEIKSSSKIPSENGKRKRPAKTTPIPMQNGDGDGQKSNAKPDEQCTDNRIPSVATDASPTSSVLPVEITLGVDQEPPLVDNNSSADSLSPIQLEEPSLLSFHTVECTKEVQEKRDGKGPNVEPNDDIQQHSLSAKSKDNSNGKNVSESLTDDKNDKDLVTLMLSDPEPQTSFSTEHLLASSHDSTGPEKKTDKSCPETVELANEIEEKLLINDLVKNPKSCAPDIDENNDSLLKADCLTDTEFFAPSTEEVDDIENEKEVSAPAVDNNVEQEEDVSAHATDNKVENEEDVSASAVDNNVEHDEDKVFVTDLFSAHNTTETNDDPELKIPNLFATAGTSEDIAVPKEASSTETTDSFTTRTDRASSFEYIIDVNFVKVPLEKLQTEGEHTSNAVSGDVDVKPEKVLDRDLTNVGEEKKNKNGASSGVVDFQMEAIETDTSTIPKEYKKTVPEYNTRTASEDNTNSASEDNTVTASEDNTVTPSEDNTVTASKNNTVTASEDNRVTASEDNTVTPSEDNTVTASKNNTATASEDNTVTTSKDNAVTASEDNTVTASEDNTVTASEDNTVTASEDNTVTASKDNTVVASEDNTVTASEDNPVTASEDNTVTASKDNTGTALEDKTVTASEDNDCENINSNLEPIRENGLDLIDTDHFSPKILESIVESGQPLLNSSECDDGATGERTTPTIGSNTSIDYQSLELSSQSVENSFCKPPANGPAENGVVF